MILSSAEIQQFAQQLRLHIFQKRIIKIPVAVHIFFIQSIVLKKSKVICHSLVLLIQGVNLQLKVD